MEKFLNDYGMIWVGDNENEAGDEDEDEARIQTTLNQPEAFSMNYDLVLQNIRNLNLLAAEGGTRITLVPGGAKLTQRPAVDLQLYTNGMGGDGAENFVLDVIETPALQTARSTSDVVPKISNLRVKSEDGEKSFILKMFFSETIGHLRSYLDAHRGCGKPPYDIISAFPHQCCHSDDTQSLLQCGLTPSAALLLRPRAKVTS
ncbi:UBX domain-containing protein 11 isoform X2 [Silurus asotus]|uniref:UBX domain-containing protein 11 isoform X2 n=1 Tax=Silurus asotus TaxID=30991 RepID=A0AAD5A8Y0_SILAS|nr:UBX domain-containing protein 11 isoform X2 [Silurus asotus]